MPAIPEPPELLSDGVVALRPLAERDIPEILIAYQDDSQLHLRHGERRPPSGAELGRRCERAEQDRLSGRGVTFTVLQAGSDVCCGQVNLHHLEWESARGEIGMWLAPQVRGRGYGPRALRQVAEWALGACPLERLAVISERDNAAMIATARAAGFEWEGILRGAALEQGRRVDKAILSLLPFDLVRVAA